MTSKQQGSSSDAPRKVKNEYKKRSWSSDEEEVLLSALKGLVANGWKSDNGFRANYMTHLEESMRMAFPHTDIKEKPHIESKLHAWKKTYSALRDILARSGVGFNLDGNFKIDCDDVLWEELCRANSKIMNWRNKKWTYYEAWQTVFGKDRATGEGAAQLGDMVQDVPKAEKGLPQQRTNTETLPINIDDELTGDSPDPVDSVGQSTYASTKPLKTSKKRPLEESISSLVDVVIEMQQSNKKKGEIVSSSYANQVESRKEMWPILHNLPGFTNQERFKAGEKLLKAPECLELFMSLGDDARPEYIEYILNLGS